MSIKKVFFTVITGVIGIYAFGMIHVIHAEAFFYENSDVTQFHVTRITSTSMTFYYEGRKTNGLLAIRSDEGEYIYRTIRNKEEITIDGLKPGMEYIYAVRFDELQYLPSIGGQRIKTIDSGTELQAIDIDYVSTGERFLRVTANEYNDMHVSVLGRLDNNHRTIPLPREGVLIKLADNDIYDVIINSPRSGFSLKIFTHNPATSDFVYIDVALNDSVDYPPNKVFDVTFNQKINNISVFISNESGRFDEYINGSLNASHIVIDSSILKKRLENNTRYYYRINARLDTARDGNTAFVEGTFLTGSQNDSVSISEQRTLPSMDQFTDNINDSALAIVEGKNHVLKQIQQPENLDKENGVIIKYGTRLQSQDQIAKEKALTFIAYGIDNQTMGLGEGERAAVVLSYQQAFNKLPQNIQDWLSVVSIAHGRWPLATNQVAELEGKKRFIEIYKRVPNMNNAYDEAGVTIITYGLKQRAENRNLNSEAQALKTYRAIFNTIPITTQEWNMLQAIAYSGATRKPDADKDLLADEDELVFGTNPYNSDTDGDGHLDGIEVLHGYSPTNPA